jgi:TRAP-type mannitol/chloroaromatic compound transport system permease small subunit
MIALVATNVLLRYAFSFGSVWAQELEWHLLAPVILLGMSHALQRGEHVRVGRVLCRLRAAQEVLRRPAVSAC